MRKSVWPLLAVFGIVLLVGLMPGSSAAHGRVPHNWPEGWSDLRQMGQVTRFLPRLRGEPDWDLGLIYLLWVGTDSDALMSGAVDYPSGTLVDPPQTVYRTEGGDRITGFDFALTDEGLHLLWVQRRGGEVVLMRGLVPPGKNQLPADEVHELLATDRSIRDPQVQVAGGELYFAWSDSAAGVLNVSVCRLSEDGSCEEVEGVPVTDDPSVSPLIFIRDDRPHLLWVERVGEAARQLRALDISTPEPECRGVLAYSVSDREVFPEIGGAEGNEVLVVIRHMGRDRLFRLGDGVWPGAGDEVQVADTAAELLASRDIAGLSIRRESGESAAFTYAVSQTDAGDRLSIFRGTVDESSGAQLQDMTPTTGGTFSPLLFEDADGHEHLFFLAVQADMSLAINYMNTRSPARVVYWDVIGVGLGSPLISLVSRFFSCLALGLATMLPNVLPVIIAAVLIFAAGALLPAGYPWVPGAAAAAAAALWRLVLPASFMYFDARQVPAGDFWAAVLLASLLVWFLLKHKGYDWPGDVLAIISVDFLWFWWFFTFTLVRI